MNPMLLHRWRTGKKLTQVELAKRLGVTSKTIIRWENGHIRIPKLVEVLITQDAAIKQLSKPRKPRPRKPKAG